MAFHAYTLPNDWVRLNFQANNNFVYDGDLAAGKVRAYLQYSGGYIFDPLIRTTQAGGHSTAQNAILAAPKIGPGFWDNAYFLNGFDASGLFNWDTSSTNGTNHIKLMSVGTDPIAQVSCYVGSGSAPGLAFKATDAGGVDVYFDSASGRLKGRKNVGGALTTVFTGTTNINVGTTYALRVEVNGNVYTPYINGSREGSFTETTSAGGGCGPVDRTLTNTARFTNFSVLPTTVSRATHWEVRNYEGVIVDSGYIQTTDSYIEITDSRLVQANGQGPYGWYRVYLTGPDRGDGQFGTAAGDATFYRLATDTAIPGNTAPWYSSEIDYANGAEQADTQMAIGAVRYNLAATGSYETTNADAYAGEAIRASRWRNIAPSNRPRKNLAAFGNINTAGKETAIAAIVAAHSDVIDVWEPRNEPDLTTAAGTFLNNELIPFANAVHGANGSASVAGPNTVTFNSSYWATLFAGGMGSYIDAISFHAYNMFNGDMQMARQSLSEMKALLSTYSQSSKPIYMTEQGYGHQYRGLFWPRWAGRWTALQWFMQEINGIPIENSHYWYDYSHGFDSFPMWWLNATGPGPQGLIIRSMVSNIGNRSLTAQLDFADGANHFAGATWTGSDGTKRIGVLAASDGLRSVRFTTDQTTLTAYDPWGNASTLTAVRGKVSLPTSGLPHFVHVPNGATCALVTSDWSWGTNLATTATVPDPKLNDGSFHNPYIYGTQTDGPYANTQSLPTTITINLAATQTLGRIVITAFAPWQGYSTVTDFRIETQYPDGDWQVVWSQASPPSKTFSFTSGDARCTAETYWSDQWVFDASFVPVQAKAFRLVVTGTSYRAYENAVAAAPHLNEQWNAGQPYPAIYLKEVQAYRIDPAITYQGWDQTDTTWDATGRVWDDAHLGTEAVSADTRTGQPDPAYRRRVTYPVRPLTKGDNWYGRR